MYMHTCTSERKRKREIGRGDFEKLTHEITGAIWQAGNSDKS